MSIDQEIKSQEDELRALKGTQIIAGSNVITYNTVSQEFTITLARWGAGVSKTVTFHASTGLNPHLVTLSISDLYRVSGDISLRIFSCYQEPQTIGSSNISLKLQFYGTGTETEQPAVYSFRVRAYGDTRGTFTIS